MNRTSFVTSVGFRFPSSSWCELASRNGFWETKSVCRSVVRHSSLALNGSIDSFFQTNNKPNQTNKNLSTTVTTNETVVVVSSIHKEYYYYESRVYDNNQYGRPTTTTLSTTTTTTTTTIQTRTSRDGTYVLGTLARSMVIFHQQCRLNYTNVFFCFCGCFFLLTD